MIEANWGAVNPDLIPGARSAVETCLGIRPGEKVVLIADEPSREVAASLAHALALQRAAWTGCLIEDIARRPPRGLRALRALRRERRRAADARYPRSSSRSRLPAEEPRRAPGWRPLRGWAHRRLKQLFRRAVYQDTFPRRCAPRESGRDSQPPTSLQSSKIVTAHAGAFYDSSK